MSICKLSTVCKGFLFALPQLLQFKILKILQRIVMFSSCSVTYTWSSNSMFLMIWCATHTFTKQSFCVACPQEMWSLHWQRDHRCGRFVAFPHTSFPLWSPFAWPALHRYPPSFLFLWLQCPSFFPSRCATSNGCLWKAAHHVCQSTFIEFTGFTLGVGYFSCCWNKDSWWEWLKRGRAYFSSWFQKVQSTVKEKVWECSLAA